MQILTRVAATLVFGLAAFHSYGILLVFYSLLSRREVFSPVFSISGHSHQSSAEYTTMILVIGVILSIKAALLLCLTVGLWKQKSWSWWGSFILIGLILLSHASAIQGLVPQAQGSHRYLVTYGILTLAVLALSAPTFFKQAQMWL